MTRIADMHRTVASCSIRRLFLATLVAGGALLVGASAAPASTAEQRCQSERYLAAAKYSACQERALAKFYGVDVDNFGNVFFKHQSTIGRCRRKYTATWARLQAKASGSGSTCDAARFVDNGNGTVTDNLTGLQWEKKQNLDSIVTPTDPHDADNKYTWSAGAAGTWEADGTTFTAFLAALNADCFAGQCDWRLPTIAELQTILLDESYPCGTSPCIDPIFGPTAVHTTTTFYYASATTSANYAGFYWSAAFSNGYVANGSKFDTQPVRAVHAGS